MQETKMMIRFKNPSYSSSSSTTTTTTTSNIINNLGVNDHKKKTRKKPDPTAPKITRPCSECGKKFWSWKALFGHMRCHPERQWRGINPPDNFTTPHKKEKGSAVVASTSGSSRNFKKMTKDDHDAALSLLMLANNGFGCYDQARSKNVGVVREGVMMMSSGGAGGGGGNVGVIREGVMMSSGGGNVDVVREGRVMISSGGGGGNDGVVREGVMRSGGGGGDNVEVVVAGGLGSGGGNNNNCVFECSSCKKVFGSHQALGGHRASHKNVKGCFANTRNNDGVVLEDEFSSLNLQTSSDGTVVHQDDIDKMLLVMGLGSGSGSGFRVQQQDHQCNICFKVFSSGQALGGHKRCHWEKIDDEDLGIDLNLPAPTPPPLPPPRIFEGCNSYCPHSSTLETLELRLGL